jgi:nitrate reductase alpha subunit
MANRIVYTDMPFVLMLDEDENGYKAGRFLRASDLGIKSENGEWKPTSIQMAYLYIAWHN